MCTDKGYTNIVYYEQQFTYTNIYYFPCAVHVYVRTCVPCTYITYFLTFVYPRGFSFLHFPQKYKKIHIKWSKVTQFSNISFRFFYYSICVLYVSDILLYLRMHTENVCTYKILYTKKYV